MTGITLEHITKIYPSGVRAVDDVSLAIEPGEFFFLLGPSGCGKTTLLRIVAGLIQPTGGRILLGERDVTGMPAEQRHTPMVFQSYALWPHMTVSSNVEFGPRMRGTGRTEARQIAAENLRRVRMDAFGKRKPNQLSGGQQQRVALARALAASGQCLLLDEPLSNLDAQLRLQMRDELRALVKETGTTGVYVTHDQKEALSMADRIGVMNEGQLVQTGTPEELYNRPASRFVADFLGEANFLTGRVLDAGRPARIETLAGVLLADHETDLDAGATIACCVRPERIELRPAAADARPADGELRAKAVKSTYLGEIRQYTCEVAETTWKITALTGSTALLAAEADVLLRVGPGDVALLPAGD